MGLIVDRTEGPGQVETVLVDGERIWGLSEKASWSATSGFLGNCGGQMQYDGQHRSCCV